MCTKCTSQYCVLKSAPRVRWLTTKKRAPSLFERCYYMVLRLLLKSSVHCSRRGDGHNLLMLTLKIFMYPPTQPPSHPLAPLIASPNDYLTYHDDEEKSLLSWSRNKREQNEEFFRKTTIKKKLSTSSDESLFKKDEKEINSNGCVSVQKLKLCVCFLRTFKLMFLKIEFKKRSKPLIPGKQNNLTLKISNL